MKISRKMIYTKIGPVLMVVTTIGVMVLILVTLFK